MAIRVSQAALIEEIQTLGTGLARISQVALIFEVEAPAVSPFTYPLSPPAIAGIGPKDFTLALENVVGESDSPFTESDQVQLWPGDMWTLDVNLPPMLEAQAEQWTSFLSMLLGKYGYFLMGDYNRLTPQGPMSGSPVVNGANASGANTLNIRGATASITNWAVAGDYIQVTAAGGQQRLYKILQNASTSSGGQATLLIRPSIREALSDGTTIVTANCAGTFRLASNKTPWKVDQNRIYTISFKAREAILP